MPIVISLPLLPVLLPVLPPVLLPVLPTDPELVGLDELLQAVAMSPSARPTDTAPTLVRRRRRPVTPGVRLPVHIGMSPFVLALSRFRHPRHTVRGSMTRKPGPRRGLRIV